MMTSRQRWLALLSGKQADRVVTDYWATGELHERVKKDLGCADDAALWRRLHIDRPANVADPLIGGVGLPRKAEAPQVPAGTDIWGVKYKTISYGYGEYVEADVRPLANVTSVDQVHAHPWPSPEDFDYSVVTRFVEQADGTRPICAGMFEPLLLYCYMRGMEQAFEDLLLDPDIADAVLGHIFDFYYEQNRRIYEAGKGKIDLTYLAEDLGGQTGPLFSPELYRRFLRPNQKRMADLARSYGVHIMYHTDGAARAFIPDLIDVVGIEILNPIQWRCPGMEREGLVRDFGKHLVFHGANDNQQTLPFGTPADVAAEVEENRRIFEKARWICAPCHNLQPNTPTANVVALYETIHASPTVATAAGIAASGAPQSANPG